MGWYSGVLRASTKDFGFSIYDMAYEGGLKVNFCLIFLSTPLGAWIGVLGWVGVIIMSIRLSSFLLILANWS